jgi:translation initiation factor IF-2
MAKTKISKVAKDLNVALPTVIEFLRKNDVDIDENPNPNTRIEDDAVQLLVNAFQTDKDLKDKSEQFLSGRIKSKSSPKDKDKDSPKPVEEIKLPADTPAKPRILGKIELDRHGNPIVPKPAQAPAKPAPEKPAEVKQEVKPAPTTKPAQPAAEAKAKTVEPVKSPETKPAHAPAQQQQAQPRHADKKHSDNPKTVTAQQQPKAKEMPKIEKKEQPVAQPHKVERTDEVFSVDRPKIGPSINVVGKIDLSSINQSTRPKKKTKEEKRNERLAKEKEHNNGANGERNGDRKKRKRINGKEKIDIEKSSNQDGNNNNGGGNNSRKFNNNNNEGGGKSRREKNKENRAKRPIHTEVNEEDVQKQVKETLARLTNKDKGQKKGAKWRKEKREANASREREQAELEQAESRVLKLTEFVTANDLAIMMDQPINNVIATCMNLGVMVSINQRLDAETINIVAEEFGYKTEFVSAEVVEAISQEEDNEEDLVARPPIVTVMGHVDHGKTSLLDYIRNANVIAGEAGGITQHIGAYNVKLEDGRRITFLDTPGHEAFTAMRARGAKVTDLCIIIVAADDNVMPQTVEAINHASAAGVPIVFAINKIDKPHANPDKIKEELAAMNYLVEEWGGKYQSQDISAKKGIGVSELMEKVLLEAEMLDLKANPNRNATGSIIESSLDKGRGYVATVLVQNGTLRQGDIIIAGNNFGRVKAMFNERNQRVTEAGPATPVLILGLNGAPTAGDTFNVLDSEQEAREIANKREQLQREQGLRTTKILTLEDIGRRRAIGNFQELNIIVKGDVDGSIEALSDSLIKLSTEEIQVNVLHKAVGEISESDVTLAAASNAVIIGFQVRPSLAARRAAEREGVDIRLYSVIYQAIEEVKDAMAGMLAPEIKEEITGTAEVLETYHISRVGTIAGAIVREGKIKRSCKVRLIRDGIVRYTGELGSLKRFKDDAKEVLLGYDCGLSIAGYNDIQVGDLIEGFEEVEVNRTL